MNHTIKITNARITLGNRDLPVESMEVEWKPLEIKDNEFHAEQLQRYRHSIRTFAVSFEMVGCAQERGPAEVESTQSEVVDPAAILRQSVRRCVSLSIPMQEIGPRIVDALPYPVSRSDLQITQWARQYVARGKRYPLPRKINAKRRAIVRRKMAEGRYPC